MGKQLKIEIRGKSEDEVDFDNTVQIIGVKLKKADLGQNLIFSDDEVSENLHQIFDTLEKNGLREVSKIDMSNAKHVQAQYNKKIDIQLGTLEKLDYKIKTASEIINNKLRYSFKNNILLEGHIEYCAGFKLEFAEDNHLINIEFLK